VTGLLASALDALAERQRREGLNGSRQKLAPRETRPKMLNVMNHSIRCWRAMLLFTAEGPRSVDEREVLYVCRDAPDGSLYVMVDPSDGKRRAHGPRGWRQRDHHGRQGALRLRHTATGPFRPTRSSLLACAAKKAETQSRRLAGKFSKLRSVTTMNRALPMCFD
jgi:hypothetical protein